MKTYIVTGGSGFIGSHLCEKLLELGHKVIAIDNHYTSSPKNVEHLMKHERFMLFYGDVRVDSIRFILSKEIDIEKEKIDYIINLACPASPIHYQKDPIYTTMTNVMGALNVLEAAKLTGARVLQASTSEVYGDPLIHPQTEEYLGNVNCIGRRSCYDEGKRCAESLFFDYHRMYGTDIGVFRIFNTYGPRMALNDGRVVSNFITSALLKKPLEIYGDGTQTRSFCYVDDLVDGIIKMAESKETGPINLGNPDEFLISELASLVLELVHGDSEPYPYPTNFFPLPQNDPLQRKPVITKAQDLLGWNPSIPIRTGLNATIEYFKKEVEKENGTDRLDSTIEK